MNDIELLELAAKAAGVEGIAIEQCGTACVIRKEGSPLIWSPLIDDGDALRLAVKLNLTILKDFDRIDVASTEDELLATEFIYERPSPTDPYAATRRAIVRAAAEIGRAMP